MQNGKLPSAGGHNYGVDALRIVSIFLAVYAHVLGGQGPLSLVSGAGYAICWLLEACCYCMLGFMGIISGYVSYSEKEKPYRYSKYISRWLQVVFYSFGITLLIKLFRPELISMKLLVKSLFPVSSNHYWYFTAYTGVFFIAPWLNKLVRNCSNKEMNILMATILLVFSCWVTFSYNFEPIFHFGDGYSFPWLTILYLVGAWMKKCDVPEKIRNSHAALCFVVCLLAAWAAQVFAGNSILVNHVSPTMLLAAVSVTVLFVKMRIGPKCAKAIAWMAPAAFGVYLCHLNQNFYRLIWADHFAWIAQKPTLLVPLYVFICAAVIFTVCLLIEKARMWLFRVLKINERAEGLCRKAGARIISGLQKRFSA